jgi:hypothetical protein
MKRSEMQSPECNCLLLKLCFYWSKTLNLEKRTLIDNLRFYFVFESRR